MEALRHCLKLYDICTVLAYYLFDICKLCSRSSGNVINILDSIQKRLYGYNQWVTTYLWD